jgi:hypothetical protein
MQDISDLTGNINICLWRVKGSLFDELITTEKRLNHRT